MCKRDLLWFWVICGISFAKLAPAQSGAPQNVTGKTAITVEEVVKLSKGGISEDIIITKIRRSGKAFDLSPEELLELKKSGVSDNIIKYMLDPAQPYTPPPSPDLKKTDAPPPVAVPKPVAKKYPEDPVASQIPPDPGLYYTGKGSPVRIDLKLLLGLKESPGLGKVLMKKPKLVAYLAGPSAKCRIQDPAPGFYFRLPEGRAIEDFVLIALEKKQDRRIIEMIGGPPKPELPPDAVKPFEHTEVGPQMIKIATSKLAAGEYLFFLVGSADPAKGSQGKGYDFGIDEKPKRQ